ncbi:MAG: pyrroline-5-carboxylate reductase, partial [Rickettsiales bacterium]
GGAMLSSWQKNSSHTISDFYVIDLNHSVGDKFSKGSFFQTLEELPNNVKPDVIIFAAKPQQLVNILPEYKKRFGAEPIYISVAAGKTIEFFSQHLGAEAKIIRAMPNTPAFVEKAITALCANSKTSDAQKATATALMEAFGKVVWVDEHNMDAVTAISGSGPAYVLLFLESLTKAGINAGLDADIAKTLALEMVHGSIHLAAKSPESFEKLRQNVTSKGGTTEAALDVLMYQNGLENLVEKAVQAAVKRAATLA